MYDAFNNKYLWISFRNIVLDKNYRTKIFYERELENRKVAETYDKETGEVILKHYFVDKVIP